MRIKLLNILTEYDRKQSTKRSHNPYAMGHYCRAIDGIMVAYEAGTPIETALKGELCGSLLRHVAKKLKLAVVYDKWD